MTPNPLGYLTLDQLRDRLESLVPRYLTALEKEGVRIPAALAGLHQAISDSTEQITRLRRASGYAMAPLPDWIPPQDC